VTPRYFPLSVPIDLLDQDFLEEFKDEYEATEDWVDGMREDWLRLVVEQIDDLFATQPDAASRLALFDHDWFELDRADEFDAWLKALRQRSVEELAGIRNNPMVKPLSDGPAWLPEDRYWPLESVVDALDDATLAGYQHDHYLATERLLREARPDWLELAIAKIDDLFATTADGPSRVAVFPARSWIDPTDPEPFDVWLRAMRKRAVESLAGNHENPMIKPSVPSDARREIF
jgi:hypothetical protein